MSYDIVIYHTSCNDGLTCVAIITKYHKDNNYEQPKLIGIHPASLVEKISDKRIIIVDVVPGNLSYLTENNDVTIIDHHTTNKNKVKDIKGVFDITHAACYLTFKFFYPDQEIPQLIKYVEDRDIWTELYPESNDLISVMVSLCANSNDTLEMIRDILDNPEKLEVIMPIGKRLSAKRSAMVMNKCRTGLSVVTMEFCKKEYIGIIFNDSYDLRSDIGNYLLGKYPTLQVICFYHWSETEQKYFISLRSKNHCSGEIARQYPGGGGHDNAAGFAHDGKIDGKLAHINTIFNIKTFGEL